jgi:hypothetical protein
MVQFQKLTRHLFLTLHGCNIHCQQRQLSKFLTRYQQFASHTYCGASGQLSRWRHSSVRLTVCYVLRCPDVQLQCSVSFVHCKHRLVLPAVLNCTRNSRCTVIADLDTSKRSTQKAFSCCNAILETDTVTPQ